MDEGLNEEMPTFTLQNSSEALFCIQRLDFKTCLLEAVEELRMRRDSEIGYEKQIHKLVVEKQELEWQKVALQQQKEALNQQHTEAMSALKKQFQARTLSMEEEKGKYRLAEEAKEREMEGLKETLKKLQISKYTLQKKLNEMEQKLQLHLLAKEDHQKNVNEFEKCHATITCQFGIIKGNHEKLEQNVMEAIQLNKKLKDVNERQASEIDNLKKELKEVTADLLRSKITCHHRVAEENLKLTAKGQELQELQQKNTAETELNTKIIEENIQLKEEKKELIVSLQHIQQLLCRQTETNTRIEMELNELKKECQTLERDNELQREKAKENEEKFFILQNEHNKTQTTWNNEARDMPNKNEMHTGNKKNKYTQTTIIISNNLPQGENGTKDVLSSTFHPTIKPTEQNSALVCVFEENSHVSTEDLDVENCVNEDDTVHPSNKQPRKDSLSKTSSIEPGSSDGSYVFEYKETATKRENIEKEFHKMQAVAEIEPLDNSYPLRHLVAKEDNKLLESIEDLEDSISNPDTDDCKGLNKPRLDIGVGLVSEKKENITNALHKIASSTSDTFSKDSKLQDGINEETVSNHLCTEIDLLKSQMAANDTAIQQDFLDECTYICSAKQTLSSHGNSTITSKILLCKQLNTSLGEVHCDGMCTNNKCDEQVNSFSTSENISPSHASFDNNSGVDSHITNEEGINKSTLVRSINLYGGKPCKGINEIASECANKDSSRLRDTSIKTPEILSLNTENVHEFQSVDLIANHITREKQRNFHTSKTTGEESVPASEALNEREEPLRGKAGGEESAKEGTEESGSLPMGTNMDFINRTARPSFEPATMEKKAEKTAVQLDLPREYQGEIQTMCASKVETYLKEKLLLQENNSQNSKESGPSMSIYAGVKEEALVSTHFKTVSDTLNARNINADPKRYCSEERNVMQKSLRDPSFPTENVTTAHPSESQQKFSQIPSEASGDILNESSNNREETGWNLQNVFIKTQISKIEKLLYSERFCQPRKRKHEEDSEAAARSKNSEM